MRNPYQNKEWLTEQYVELEHSLREVASKIEVSTRTVANWIARFDIETRSLGDAQTDGDLEPVKDEEWLREQYWGRGRSMDDMADVTGVSKNTVKNWIQRHEIETRSMTEGNTEPLKDDSWLRTQYVEECRAMNGIADELGVTHTTVHYWLSKHGIETRYGKRDPDDLCHTVDSDWELKIARLLNANEIEYEHEAIHTTYSTLADFGDGLRKTHTYTPDMLIPEEYVIEVKGARWGQIYDLAGTAERKAQAMMNHLDDREYVVVGIEIPCDIHYSWDEREDLLELFK